MGMIHIVRFGCIHINHANNEFVNMSHIMNMLWV